MNSVTRLGSLPGFGRSTFPLIRLHGNSCDRRVGWRALPQLPVTLDVQNRRSAVGFCAPRAYLCCGIFYERHL